MKKIFPLLILPLFFYLTSCDSSSSGSSPTVDVTGSWSGTFTFAETTDSIRFNFSQDGSNVTATDSDGDAWVGSVSGNTLRIASSATDGGDVASVEVSGSVEEPSMALTGTFEATIGGVSVSGPVTINLTRN